jgi:hypothetical protein
MHTRLNRLALLAAATLLLYLAYLGAFRPWMRTWGATAEELESSYPGDELFPQAARVETRAITIDAHVDQVWPWVAQLGQDKGGFYTYEFIEALGGTRVKNADRLLGVADPKEGDKLWLADPKVMGGQAFNTVAKVSAPTFLVTTRKGGADVRPDGSWAFIVSATPEGSTRLVVRNRSERPASTLEGLWGLAFLEPAHFVMERGLLLGLKARAEGHTGGVSTLEPLSWFFLLGLALVAALVAVLARRSVPSMAVFFCAGASLVVLPLLHPPLPLTVAVAVGLAAAFGWALAVARRPAPAPAA